MCDLRRARVSWRLVFLPGGRGGDRARAFGQGIHARVEQVEVLQASGFAVSDVRRAQVSWRLVFLPGGPRGGDRARAFGQGIHAWSSRSQCCRPRGFAVSDVRRGQVSWRLVFLPAAARRRSSESLRPGDPCAIERVAVLQASVFAVCGSPPCPGSWRRSSCRRPRRRSSESLRPGDPCAIERVAVLQASVFAVSDLRRGQVSWRLVFLPGAAAAIEREPCPPGANREHAGTESESGLAGRGAYMSDPVANTRRSTAAAAPGPVDQVEAQAHCLSDSAKASVPACSQLSRRSTGADGSGGRADCSSLPAAAVIEGSHEPWRVNL